MGKSPLVSILGEPAQDDVPCAPVPPVPTSMPHFLLMFLSHFCHAYQLARTFTYSDSCAGTEPWEKRY